MTGHMDEWLKAIERDRAMQAIIALDENEDLHAELKRLRLEISAALTLIGADVITEDRLRTERNELRAQLAKLESSGFERANMIVEDFRRGLRQGIENIAIETIDLSSPFAGQGYAEGQKVRDDLAAKLEAANAERQAIARALNEAGIEHSGHVAQVERVKMLAARDKERGREIVRRQLIIKDMREKNEAANALMALAYDFLIEERAWSADDFERMLDLAALFKSYRQKVPPVS